MRGKTRKAHTKKMKENSFRYLTLIQNNNVHNYHVNIKKFNTYPYQKDEPTNTAGHNNYYPTLCLRST